MKNDSKILNLGEITKLSKGAWLCNKMGALSFPNSFIRL